MYSNTWFDQNKDTWDLLFAPLKGKKNLIFLEIGCFEGRATVWLLEHVLTHPTARITVVDTFKGSREHTNLPPIEKNFMSNISPYMKPQSTQDKVTIWKGRSEYILPLTDRSQFDFIYIDGSHDALDVLRDGIHAWDLLKPRCFMIFDDYTWGDIMPMELRPYTAINSLITTLGSYCTAERHNDQMVVYKY